MSTYFTDMLTEAHKTYALAGNANGSRLTPFKETSKSLIDVVGRNPGIPLRDAIKKIEHHYRKDTTAFSCLSKWIREGKINVRAELVNNKTVLFPV